MCVCTCVCVCVCTCVYVQVCMHICACVCVRVSVYSVFMLNRFAIYVSSVGTVRFSQTTYNVNENAGPAQPTLVLSDPPDTDITVEVANSDGSATGEYCSILINY